MWKKMEERDARQRYIPIYDVGPYGATLDWH